MVGMSTSEEMIKQKQWVDIVLKYLENTISKLNEDYVQDEWKVRFILDNLNSYLHFDSKQNNINHKILQCKVKWIIKSFLEKVNPEIVINSLDSLYNWTSETREFQDEMINLFKIKYFDYILDNFTENIYDWESFRIYNKIRPENYNIFFAQLLSKLREWNKKLEVNVINIIYWIISYGVIKDFDIKLLEEILKLVDIDNINIRRIWSIKEEINEKFNKDNEYYVLFDKYFNK